MLQIVVGLFGNLIGILFLNERAYYVHYKYKLMKEKYDEKYSK